MNSDNDIAQKKKDKSDINGQRSYMAHKRPSASGEPDPLNPGFSQMKYLSKFLYLSNRLEYLTGYTLNSNKLHIYGKPHNGKCDGMIKEIYENISALMHIIDILPDEDMLWNENVLCLAVGDGKHPRAGILFALATKWAVISIDPIMDVKWVEQPEHAEIANETDNFSKLLPNLKCVANTDNEVINEINFNKYEYVVIIGVHTHANMAHVKNTITKKKRDAKILLLYVPCCKGIPKEFNKTNRTIDLNDEAIPTDKNRVIVWKFNC